MCLSGYDEKCTLRMYSHAYPNVPNEKDPGHRRRAPVGIGPGLVITTQGIDLPTARLLILRLFPHSKTVTPT